MAAEFRPYLVVRNYRPFVQAINRAGPETKAAVTTALKKIGEPVRQDAARRLEPYSARSAAGYRVKVTTSSVKVQQSLRKTTGEHPEYGDLQMKRALLPARRANSLRTTEEFEAALDLVIAHFYR
jgi:hypothetical protein